MKTTELKLTSIAAAAAFGVAMSLGATGEAHAAFTSCTGTTTAGVSWNIADNVSPTTDCTILLPLGAQGGGTESVNDPLTVNTEMFFDVSTWIFDGKFDDIGDPEKEEDLSDLLDFVGTQTNGTFALVGDLELGVQNGYRIFIDDIMLVFKDGANTNLVGYLLDLDELVLDPDSGLYSNPFVNPPFDVTATDGVYVDEDGEVSGDRISHISVYYRVDREPVDPDDPGDIPEPGMLFLMGAGLLGLGMARRRKSA